MKLSRGALLVIVIALLVVLVGVAQTITKGTDTSHHEAGCCPEDAAPSMSQLATEEPPSECPTSEGKGKPIDEPSTSHGECPH